MYFTDYGARPGRARRRSVHVSSRAILAALVAVTLWSAPSARSQGCIASRGAGMSCTHFGPHSGDILPPASGFQISAGYRWFESDRHFRGDHEEPERQEAGTEVINNSHFVDLGITYAFGPRYSATATFPFVVHNRSQTVRSNDVERTILNRFDTQSAGLGDIRLMGNAWLLEPSRPRRANLLLGAGVDMPTGDDDVRDTFQRFDSASGQILAQERTVDQSIQPGDGGWGIVLDLYGYWQFLPRFNTFVNGSYTITPEEKSGVPTYRTRNPYEAEMSIGDSYFGRAGLEYVLWPKYGVVLSLAGRIEGVPARDVVGGSEGFRRPGYAVSVEPGISAMIKSWSMNLYTPVAVYRNRVQSVPDKQWSKETGDYQHGDAAFADFVVMFSLSKRF